jgi:hypothetical protein
LGENIEYMRKPGRSLSHGVQSVRRSTPKLLTFEIYNPETDDLDSDTSHSSSPDSDDSIISVIADCLQKKQSTNNPGEEDRSEGQSCSIPQPPTRLPPLPETSPQSSELCSLTDPMIATNKSDEKVMVPLLLQLSLEDIDRKSEERTKCLLNLLGENKTVLQSINVAKRQRVGVRIEMKKGATDEPASNLRKVEESWLPRSKSCSPNKMDPRNAQRMNQVESNMDPDSPLKLGSLDSIIGLSRPENCSNNSKNIKSSASIRDSDADDNQPPGTTITPADKEREIHTRVSIENFYFILIHIGTVQSEWSWIKGVIN